MKHSSVAVFLALSLSSISLAQSPQTQPTTRPAATQPVVRPVVMDIAYGVVDPYSSVAERNLFLKLVGVDSEMDQKEFAAAAAKGETFVRSFDKWENARLFDKNKNDKLDWFEADAYRRGLQAAAVKAYDANKNGRVDGTEREALVRVLREGKLVPLTEAQSVQVIIAAPESTAPAGQPGAVATPAGLAEPSAPQQGGNEAPTAPAAATQQRQERLLAEFDADKDGRLDEQESAAMRETQRQRWQQRADQFRVRQFDQDRDGHLNEQEQAAADEARRRMERWGREIETRMFDSNGDGQVTDEERQAVREQLRQQWQQWQDNWNRQMDTDGDGQVSDTERRAFGEQMRQRVADRMRQFSQPYDTDGDGQITGEERQKLFEGMRQEWETRQKKYDTDGDGRINAEEMRQMMEDLRREFTDPAQEPATTP